MLRSIINKLGYDIIPVVMSIDKDKNLGREFEYIYNICKSYTMTTKERCYALYKAIQYIIKAGIKGVFVECGVWRGGSAMIMALTLQQLNAQRTIFLYDTFEGMPQAGEYDIDFKGNPPKRDYDWIKVSKEQVYENISKTNYLDFTLIEGKVEDTLPKFAPYKISLLRLDTDWYESTKHELEYLYPYLEKGGVILIDDYGWWNGAKKATDEYFKDKPILLNRIDVTGRIGVKFHN